ncbi:MAG: hypothetical protein DRQ59_15035 [Gammaproteobacteria bacterium]|nr:MAG: hypothetical protein DRQ59_15035 [Gammaproteobacteria bacterium]
MQESAYTLLKSVLTRLPMILARQSYVGVYLNYFASVSFCLPIQEQTNEINIYEFTRARDYSFNDCAVDHWFDLFFMGSNIQFVREPLGQIPSIIISLLTYRLDLLFDSPYMQVI